MLTAPASPPVPGSAAASVPERGGTPVAAAAIAALWAAPSDDAPAGDAPAGGPRDESLEILRILVVAADPLARAGLAALVAAIPDCRVAGELSPDAELQDAIERLDPDAVVWDLGAGGAAPDQEGLREPAPPVLVLAPHGLSGGPWAAPGAGGGVLPRDTDAPTLAAALRAAAQGLVVLDPDFVSAPAPRTRAAGELTEPLTPREVDVLQSLAAGLPNKLIAERLGISEHTVRFHLTSIFGKLDAHTRTEAVSRAARLGLIVL